MTFDRFNAWFSLLTNIGVLLGVLVLVIEIDQNTKALEIQSDSASWSQWISLNQIVSGSPDLADIIVKGNADPTALSPAEVMRYHQYLSNVLNVAEHGFRTVERHSEWDQLDAVGAVVVTFVLDTPGGRAFYDSNKRFFQSDFTKWVDQIGTEP